MGTTTAPKRCGEHKGIGPTGEVVDGARCCWCGCSGPLMSVQKAGLAWHTVCGRCLRKAVPWPAYVYFRNAFMKGVSAQATAQERQKRSKDRYRQERIQL